jgi:hypothetical protein
MHLNKTESIYCVHVFMYPSDCFAVVCLVVFHAEVFKTFLANEFSCICGISLLIALIVIGCPRKKMFCKIP